MIYHLCADQDKRLYGPSQRPNGAAARSCTLRSTSETTMKVSLGSGQESMFKVGPRESRDATYPSQARWYSRCRHRLARACHTVCFRVSLSRSSEDKRFFQSMGKDGEWGRQSTTEHGKYHKPHHTHTWIITRHTIPPGGGLPLMTNVTVRYLSVQSPIRSGTSQRWTGGWQSLEQYS